MSDLHSPVEQPSDASEPIAELQGASPHFQADKDNTISPKNILVNYLAKTSPVFARLQILKDEAWENTKADTYWQNRRDVVAASSTENDQIFYDMGKQIAQELHDKTGALIVTSLSSQPLQILDLCMAPGGSTWTALSCNPGAVTYGITLPEDLGGYKNAIALPAENVLFQDLTMYAEEFDVDIKTIPASHPDFDNFLSNRPFIDKRFQLIFCGGTVQRDHVLRYEHRQRFERTRLQVSQLILAMQRITPGGTIVMLLRVRDLWDTVSILYQFNSFSDITLFKPAKKHAIVSSFYLVAKNIRPGEESAAAVEKWKKTWFRATLGDEQGGGKSDPEPDAETVEDLLREFGPKLVELGTPVWEIQAEALERQKNRKYKPWSK